MRVQDFRFPSSTIIVIATMLVASQSAQAWNWKDVFADIAKGVAVGLIVQGVKETVTSNRSEPSHQSLDNYQPVSAAPPDDPYAGAREIARAHFLADSYCNTDEIMSMYANSVYYEDELVSLTHLRKVKEGYCRKFRRDASFKIKDNEIKVSPFSQDNSITLIDYAVNYDVYRLQTKKRDSGTTAVRLAVHSGKIVAESHRRLTD